MNAAILRTDGLEHCRNIVGTQIELAINHPSLNLDSSPQCPPMVYALFSRFTTHFDGTTIRKSMWQLLRQRRIQYPGTVGAWQSSMR